MKKLNIEEKPDKNNNPMKIITTEDNSKVFVNSKYDEDVYNAVDETKEIELIKDGNFWKIKPESLGIKEKPKSNYKGQQMNQVMEKKAEMISQAQDRKQDGIRMSAACRDATLVVVNLYPELANAENKEGYIRDEWKRWRSWFFNESGEAPNEPFN